MLLLVYGWFSVNPLEGGWSTQGDYDYDYDIYSLYLNVADANDPEKIGTGVPISNRWIRAM